MYDTYQKRSVPAYIYNQYQFFSNKVLLNKAFIQTMEKLYLNEAAFTQPTWQIRFDTLRLT